MIKVVSSIYIVAKVGPPRLLCKSAVEFPIWIQNVDAIAYRLMSDI